MVDTCLHGCLSNFATGLFVKLKHIFEVESIPSFRTSAKFKANKMGVLPKKWDVKSPLQKDSRVTCISLIQPILAYFYPCINKKDTETIASANLEDAK